MLQNYDYHILYQLGARYVGGELGAVQQAAEMLAAAADDIEQRQVKSEFHEGVRNRALHQGQVDDAMRALEEFASVLV